MRFKRWLIEFKARWKLSSPHFFVRLQMWGVALAGAGIMPQLFVGISDFWQDIFKSVAGFGAAMYFVGRLPVSNPDQIKDIVEKEKQLRDERRNPH